MAAAEKALPAAAAVLPAEERQDLIDSVGAQIALAKGDPSKSTRRWPSLPKRKPTMRRRRTNRLGTGHRPLFLKKPNFALAEKCALRAVALSKEKEGDKLDTLARLRWLQGRKAEAVQLQEKAVAAATDSEMKGILQQTLDALKKGSCPRRRSWPTRIAEAMERRDFLAHSAAWLGTSLLAGCAARPGTARIRPITHGPKFHWRGYYDKFLFSADDRFVLANETSFEGRSPTQADSIRVGMVDTQDGDRWTDLGGSHAWNWQQGCMLQWVPGSDRDVAWNDREDGRFVTRILDVKSGRTRTLPHPFYTFSPDGRTAFAPDFARLDVTRPGYGYATGADRDPWKLVRMPADTGIWRLDIATSRQRLLFSIADAAQLPFTGPAASAFKPDSVHWFNHLLCNTDGTRLFFLHRWRTPAIGPASARVR
ncbi:hypothetical protein EMGBD4_16660 [Verrucomicrobiota bacterium]|nr:hypothetical protein EMGBD4_16660 [Verrucomicrobiota bacterium]